METPEIDEIIDIRQSPEWEWYLNWLGWQKIAINPYKNLYFLNTPILKVAKMQRPLPLDCEELEEINNIAKNLKLPFIKLEPALSQKIENLESLGFNTLASPLLPPSTIFVPLFNDINQLWTDLSPSVKYSINRAKKEGGAVEFISNPNSNSLNEVYPIIVDTAKTRNFLAPSLQDLKTKRDIWQDRFYLSVVRSNNKIYGVKLYLGFEKTSWYMHGGTTKEGRKTKFGYLLLWESIMQLKSLGYLYLDLEGKDDKRFPGFTKNWGGFSHFKERFGGIHVQFPHPRVNIYNKWLCTMCKITRGTVTL